MAPEMEDLTRFLDEVSAHLPAGSARADIIAELRSAILDRAEEIGPGPTDPEALRAALAGFGEPAEIAIAYAGERHLIGSRAYPAFIAYTGIVFAIHLVMIIAATIFDAAIDVFPLNARRAAGGKSIVGFVLAAVQALLFDIGLMVVLFSVVERTRRGARLPRIAFPVRASYRQCAARAALALIVLAALNLFRDRVFVVWSGEEQVSLLTRSFLSALPAIDVFLGLLVLREALYVAFGERRAILAIDGLTSFAGVCLTLWLITQPALLAFPAVVARAPAALPTLNHFVSAAVRLILVLFAAAFAMAAVKRFYRLHRRVA